MSWVLRTAPRVFGACHHQPWPGRHWQPWPIFCLSGYSHSRPTCDHSTGRGCGQAATDQPSWIWPQWPGALQWGAGDAGTQTPPNIPPSDGPTPNPRLSPGIGISVLLSPSKNSVLLKAICEPWQVIGSRAQPPNLKLILVVLRQGSGEDSTKLGPTTPGPSAVSLIAS